MLFIGLVLMGVFSYKHLPMELYPNAELPVLSVSISPDTESDPSYIENQVAIPVEGAVSALNGVEKIETQIYSRGGQVTVSFKQDVDLKYTFLQLEEKIKSITPNLPDNFQLNVNKSSSGSASDMFMNLRILGEDDQQGHFEQLGGKEFCRFGLREQQTLLCQRDSRVPCHGRLGKYRGCRWSDPVERHR